MEYAIGLVLPPVIDYFNKNLQNDYEKSWMTVIVCLAIAGLIDRTLIVNGDYHSVAAILTLAATLTGEAMTVYQVYWKSSSLRAKLPGNGVEQG